MNVSVSISHMFYVLLHPIIWNLVFVLRINCCRDIFLFDFFAFFFFAFFFLLSFLVWVLFMLIFGESAHKAFQTKMVQSIKLHRREWEWELERYRKREERRKRERERKRAKAPFVVQTAVHAIHQHRFITNIVNYGMLFRLQLHRRRFPSNFCTTWMCFFLLRLFCRLFVSWFFSLLLWLGNILQWFLLL